MMDNSIKSIAINAVAFSKKFELNKGLYNKNGTVKKSSVARVKEILDEFLKDTDVPFELEIPDCNKYIIIVYNWDKIKFKRGHEYENVYYFDINFINYLNTIQDKLLKKGFDILDFIVNNMAWRY